MQRIISQSIIFDMLEESVIVTNNIGTVLYINKSAERMLNRKFEDGIGRLLDDIFPVQSSKNSYFFFKNRKQPIDRIYIDNIHLTEKITLTCRIIPIFDQETITRYVIILGTISQKEQNKEIYRLIAENMTDLIFIVNQKGEVEYASPSHLQTLGFIPTSIMEINECIHPDDALHVEEFQKKLLLFLHEGTCQYRLKATNGNWVYLESKTSPIIDDTGLTDKVVVISRQITEQKLYEEKLKYLAYHDPLTELPNRSSFMEQLHTLIDFSEKNFQSFALLYLDCDDFKHINETFGHETGDWFLQQLARRMKECIRDKGMIMRMGGDEFTLLIPNIESETQVASIAEQLMDSLDKPWTIGEQRISLSVSIGIAVYPQDGETGSSLLKSADAAMYFSKKHGENQFQFFDRNRYFHTSNHHKFKKDLRKALKNNELLVYYQPIVNVETASIHAIESLIRWNHPKYGMLPPIEFIPVAEETGLIVQIGEWVLEQACRQLKKWHNAGYHNLKISINLSPLQLEQYHFVEKTFQLLKDIGLDPEYLALEITENIMMDENSHMAKVLDQLQKHKIAISIDDFGTGYSSLAYLKSFPVDTIKIDRTFIFNLTNQDIAIISAILKLSHSLDLRTIAEGIESMEHAKYLKTLGCFLQQGYYFGKPAPPEQLEQNFAKIEHVLMDLYE